MRMPAVLRRKPETAAAALARVRRVLNDEFAAPAALRVAKGERDQVLRQSEEAERHRRNAEHVLRRCREWLEGLGDVMLEEVSVEAPPDASLSDVRDRIKDKEAEMSALRRAATPSADIRERIEAYVASIGKFGTPIVRGIGAGESLEVLWPQSHEANRQDTVGFSQNLFKADPLPVLAHLIPDVIVERLMAEIEHSASIITDHLYRPAQKAGRKEGVRGSCRLTSAA
jgi:hypothetical protein